MLLRHVLELQDWNLLFENDITDSDFYGDAAKAVKAARKYHADTGKFPPMHYIETECKIEFKPAIALSYAIEKFHDDVLSQKLKKLHNNSFKYLNEGDPTKCYTSLKTEISKIECKKNRIESFKETGLERIERYNRKKLEGIRGVLAPYPSLRDTIILYENGTLNTILGTPSAGKCLEENTPVTCGDGLRRTIKQVVKEKHDIYSINTDTGQFSQQTPSDWIYSGEKECFRVTMKSGDYIEGSADHPILTSKGWVKIRDLKNNDIVARSNNIPEPKETIEWSKDELTLVAALLADGELTRTTEISYTKDTPSLINLMQETCERLGYKFYKRPSQKRSCEFTIDSRVWEILIKYGIKPGKSVDKKMPTCIYKMPNEAIKWFLTVFWNHDGDIYKKVNEYNNTIALSMCLGSEDLVRGIRHCLFRLGIFSKYSEKITNFNTKAYRLRVLTESTRVFLDNINIFRSLDFKVECHSRSYVSKRENKSELRDCKHIFWDRIKTIKSVGVKHTYDLSVAGTHSFEAGYTHVHNSWLTSYHSVYAGFFLGKTVLHVTMENSKSSIEDRMDAIYHKIPFRNIRDGLVDSRMEKYWVDNASEMPNKKGDIYIVDNTAIRTCDQIFQLITDKKPDFVVIDGAYELQSDIKGNNFEKSDEVIKDLFFMAAETDIPFLVSAQLNESANKATARNLGFSARGNKNWFVRSAVILGVLAQDDDVLLNRAKIIIGKNREAGDMNGISEFYINVDRVEMNFEEQTEDKVDKDLLDYTL